jgi:uncharacterized protein (TIGR02597 family)
MKRLIALCALTFAATLLAADVAYSPPAGGMTFGINGGTPSAPVTTDFSIPLLDNPATGGASRGKITAITSTTLTAADANWVPGALANAASPYAVRIGSGAAEGVTVGITANTADTLTISGRNLAQLGITVGTDTFQLIPIDTLNTLFGSSTFLGGSSPAAADIVTVSGTVQLSYYYNSSLNRWVRTSGPTTDRGNIPLPPNTALSVTRKGPAFALTIVGRVPDTKLNVLVANSGSTYTNTGFPTDTTIGSLALQSSIAGWVSASSASEADILAVTSNGNWFYYFHNGTNWRRTTGPTTNRDSVVIPAGTPIQLFKRGSAAGESLFLRELPYSI